MKTIILYGYPLECEAFRQYLKEYTISCLSEQDELVCTLRKMSPAAAFVIMEKAAGMEGVFAIRKIYPEIPYTGNAAADGVLYHYACIAKEKRISFKVYCKLDGLSISDTDLCCLLGNALDNAVNACETYNGERYIMISSEKNRDMLMLTIDNSFDGIVERKGEKILSRKRENKEGIGIRSMRQICEK